MRTAVLVSVMVLVMPGVLLAQRPGMGPGPQRQALQRQVMQRFMESYRTQAGLSDEQTQQFQEIAQDGFRVRRELQQGRMLMLRAIEEQMRPGVAADMDSLTNLLDGLTANSEQMIGQLRLEQEGYSEFLTPVQRALLVLQFERLQRQIQGVMRRRGQGVP